MQRKPRCEVAVSIVCGHLLLGLLILFAGFAVFSGKTWGRTIGILAVLSALANFAFIPYYPVWSLVVIALDVFVIWALCLYNRDAASDVAAERR